MRTWRAGLRVYRWLLHLLPAYFRAQYGPDLQRSVEEALDEAALRGNVRVVLRWFKEAADLLVTAVRVRFSGAPPVVAHDKPANDGVLGMLRNLRISARTLVRRPGFALAAALTLGAGVGCAAAAFGVVDALLLQPLAHRRPGQLVMVWRDLPKMQMSRAPVSLPTLLDLRDQSTAVLSGLEAYTAGATALLQAGAEPEAANGARVTGGLFRMLGNRAVLGRTIEPADDALDAEPVVVLSHVLWQRHFAADPDVLGKSIEIRGARYRIVGVMGPEFVFPSTRAELWIALRADPARQDRDSNFLVAIGRLRDGVSIEQAQTRLVAAFDRLARAWPGIYDDGRLRVEARSEFLVGDARKVVLLGGAAALLLLLIACANLGNLMLVRGMARSRELALRTALGATRVRVAGELLAEAVLIGVAGALLGVVLAVLLTRLVVVLAPESLPRRLELGVDARVFAFATIIAFTSALVCALVPALRPLEQQRSALATAGGSVTRRGRTLQSGLLVVQVSLAFVLLVMAGLLTGTLTHLLSVPVGFDGSRVLTASVSLPAARYGSDERIGVFYDELLRRLSALPGVQSVGGTWALPFSPDYAGARYVPEGSQDKEGIIVSSAPIRGDYFATVGMQIVSGRHFDTRDRADARPVGIINETLAKRFWPGQDPLGKRMVDPNDAQDVLTVIGVVNDVHRRDLSTEVGPEVYQPHTQATWDGSLSLTVRTSGDPLASSSALRSTVHALDPQLPVSRVNTLDALVSSSVATQRFRAGIIAALSAAALLLTLLGIYSVQAMYVSTCRRDLAVRMALGARPGRVIAEIIGRGLRLTLLGVIIGGSLAALAARSLDTLFFGLSPLDPLTWCGMMGLLVAAAALACWLPTRRVGRVDPMLTLRTD